MAVQGCRADRIPADFHVPDLDDLTLQTVIHAALPWAKGFHVVEKNGQKGAGAVTFDNICHEGSDFMAPVRGEDGYVRIAGLSRRSPGWDDKQFHLWKNIDGWMKMHTWDIQLVKDFGSLHGIAMAAERIRKDDGLKPRLKEDIDVYLRALFYHIDRELDEGECCAVALANALSPVTLIPVRDKDYRIVRYVDVIEVLTALRKEAQSSGDPATVEFLKLIRANTYFRRFKGKGQVDDWHKAREGFEEADWGKLGERQERVAEPMLTSFKTHRAYCKDNRYLDIYDLSCRPCPSRTIKTQDGKACGTCSAGSRPDESLGVCRRVPTPQSCARLKPPRLFDPDTQKCGRPCEEGTMPSGRECVPKGDWDDDSVDF